MIILKIFFSPLIAIWWVIKFTVKLVVKIITWIFAAIGLGFLLSKR